MGGAGIGGGAIQVDGPVTPAPRQCAPQCCDNAATVPGHMCDSDGTLLLLLL